MNTLKVTTYPHENHVSEGLQALKNRPKSVPRIIWSVEEFPLLIKNCKKLGSANKIANRSQQPWQQVSELGAQGGVSETMQTGTTGLAALVGTPHYMSPEQFREGTVVTHQTDLWSLGVVMCCCADVLPCGVWVSRIVDVRVLAYPSEQTADFFRGALCVKNFSAGAREGQPPAPKGS